MHALQAVGILTQYPKRIEAIKEAQELLRMKVLVLVRSTVIRVQGKGPRVAGRGGRALLAQGPRAPGTGRSAAALMREQRPAGHVRLVPAHQPLQPATPDPRLPDASDRIPRAPCGP